MDLLFHQPGHLGLTFGVAVAGMMLVEELRDLALGLVHRRRNNVAGRLFRELDNVLAEIRLDGFDAGALQCLVDGDLFAHHGLALGDALGTDTPADTDDDVAGVLRRARPVDFSTVGLHALLESFQIKVQILQRVLFDTTGRAAQRVELGQPLHRRAAVLDEATPDEAHGPLQVRIDERYTGAILELACCGFHRCPPGVSASPSPIAGTSVMPASTSAT